jgi:hypothetical protein
MPLPQLAIDELKAIHRQRTGQELSNDDARAMANRILQLFAVLLEVRSPIDPDNEIRTQFHERS